MPLNGAFRSISDIQASDQDLCPIFRREYSRFTREKAVREGLSTFFASQGPQSAQIPYGVFLSWKKHDTELVALVADLEKTLNIRPDLVILPAEAPLDEVKRLNVPELYLDCATIAPREYERLFWDWSRAHVAGVVFDNDTFTRGHIALAERFTLKSIIKNVMYDRHVDAINKSSADGYIVSRPI